MLGSSKFSRLLRRGRGSLLCSNESTCREDSPPGDRTTDIATRSSDSMGSNRSLPRNRKSLIQSVCVGHGWSLHAFRLLLTTRAVQCRRVYGMNPAAGRRNDGRSEADFFRCRFRHREGNTPTPVSLVHGAKQGRSSYSHGGIQGSCYLIVLFQPRATPQNLRQPELADGTFHVADLALRRRRSSNPLGRLSANATYHVGMGESLGGSLVRLDLQR